MKHWVYFLLKGKIIIYIGCTMDCARRINEHKLNGKRFTSFRTIECSSYEIASAYEKRWIKRFRPRDNRNGFGGTVNNISMCLYIKKDRAQKLREFAVKEQKTISIVVENALHQSYGL